MTPNLPFCIRLRPTAAHVAIGVGGMLLWAVLVLVLLVALGRRPRPVGPSEPDRRRQAHAALLAPVVNLAG